MMAKFLAYPGPFGGKIRCFGVAGLVFFGGVGAFLKALASLGCVCALGKLFGVDFACPAKRRFLAERPEVGGGVAFAGSGFRWVLLAVVG